MAGNASYNTVRPAIKFPGSAFQNKRNSSNVPSNIQKAKDNYFLAIDKGQKTEQSEDNEDGPISIEQVEEFLQERMVEDMLYYAGSKVEQFQSRERLPLDKIQIQDESVYSRNINPQSSRRHKRFMQSRRNLVSQDTGRGNVRTRQVRIP